MVEDSSPTHFRCMLQFHCNVGLLSGGVVCLSSVSSQLVCNDYWSPNLTPFLRSSIAKSITTPPYIWASPRSMGSSSNFAVKLTVLKVRLALLVRANRVILANFSRFVTIIIIKLYWTVGQTAIHSRDRRQTDRQATDDRQRIMTIAEHCNEIAIATFG